MATNSAFAPLALQQFSKEDFTTDEGVANFNQTMSLLTQRVNAVQGNVGKAAFPAGVDMAGQAIENVNGVGPEHSAISHAQAEARYSAAALSPQLEAGQKNSPKSLRRVNDSAQQEMYSGYMDSIMNTTPTCNSSTVSGSGPTVTVSAGYHNYPGGKVVAYSSRTDSLPLPASVTIVSLTRTSSVVTAVFSAPLSLLPGQVVNIDGATDTSFDGSFVLSTISGVNATWPQIAPNASTTGGTASGAGVYYYALERYATTLSLQGPFDADTQLNRLDVNRDGSILIAVAVITASGLDLTQSAAGATAPAQTNGIRITNRL